MTTQQIREAKRLIRKENKEKRAALSPELKDSLDGKICSFLINSMSFRYADVLLMFCPKEREIDITPVFCEAKKCGKRVAFPRCVSKGVMKFYFVESLDELTEGKYGTREPAENPDKEFTSSEHPLCIVPCLAADKRGYRVGYGGGYYDRFLSHFDGISACVQYEMFVTQDGVPVEKRYDKKTDLLITDGGVTVVGKKK